MHKKGNWTKHYKHPERKGNADIRALSRISKTKVLEKLYKLENSKTLGTNFGKKKIRKPELPLIKKQRKATKDPTTTYSSNYGPNRHGWNIQKHNTIEGSRLTKRAANDKQETGAARERRKLFSKVLPFTSGEDPEAKQKERRKRKKWITENLEWGKI